jgi:EmrB/QacA subfamily drug resistance transporter
VRKSVAATDAKQTPTRALVFLALPCVAQFLNVFDINVVIIALPSIGADLGFSSTGLQWVVSANVLCFAGFLLLAGRMADLFGPRRVFMTGLAILTAASLACGLAQGPAVLLVARAVQGLGAATTAPAALSIITTTFTGGDRNAALGVWTAVAAGGGAVGLVAGGVITDALGWRWVFLCVIPIGISSLLAARRWLPEHRRRDARGRVDVRGALLGTSGLSLLVLGLTRVQPGGHILGAAVVVLVAAVLIAAFVFAESRVPDPLVPLRMFRSRDAVGANLVAFTLTATTSPTGVLAVVYVQTVLDHSPTRAGFVQLPFSLLVIGGSAVGSWLIGRYGTRLGMAAGLGVIAAGIVLVSRISAEAGLAHVVGGAALAGLGLGCASVASTARGTAAASSNDQGLASGLLNVSAQVGTAVGLALFVTAAALRTDATTATGEVALVEGYRVAFLLAATLAVFAVSVPTALGRKSKAGGGTHRAEVDG